MVKKNRESQLTSSNILDQMIDGRVVETWEMYDRQILSQQLSMFLCMPPKQAPKRVR